MRDRVALAAAAVLLWAPLVLPNHPGAMTPGALKVLPLEWPALLFALAACQGRAVPVLRIAVTAALVAMTIVKLADLAANAAYQRMFNPVLDLYLVPAAWHMLSGAVGPIRAGVAAIVLLLALALTGTGIWWATGRVARLRAPVGLTLAACAMVVLDLARPGLVPGAAFTARLGAEHVRFAAAARADIRRFRCAAAHDPYGGAQGDGLLTQLRGHDVLVLVLESYGRAALEDPRYRDTTRSVLAEMEADLAARGLSQRSAYLTSPVIGGQSWLAHASLLSGLWIDSQRRYRALLASDRRTLVHLARRAGWRTAAVMPAIVRDWPEADYFGYDIVLDGPALDYRGPAFNWVTMPDQFTLAAFERALLGSGPRPPVFAEIALISSHAPWTPIPERLPWDTVGDGSIYARYAGLGPAPEVLWRDYEQVRAQYAQALAYALDVAGAFAVRRAEDAPLIVIMGDHQPAPLIAGESGRDVPVHFIGPPEVLEAIEDWRWSDGMTPAAGAPVWRMDAFRDQFLDAFSDAAPGARSTSHFTAADPTLGSCG